MDEPIPDRDQYRYANSVRVYEDPQLELWRRVRIFVARLWNPIYRVENWASDLTTRVAAWAVDGGFRRLLRLPPPPPVGATITPAEARAEEE
jgi:hypothetical protein